jgi:hypothetical protein
MRTSNCSPPSWADRRTSRALVSHQLYTLAEGAAQKSVGFDSHVLRFGHAPHSRGVFIYAHAELLCENCDKEREITDSFLF